MKKKEKIIGERKTILIFGISSFVGSSLAEFLKKDYRVVGTYNKNSVKILGVLTLPCDVLNKSVVQSITYAVKPDVSIYAIGMSSVIDCALKEEMADALNTNGLFNVVENCQRYKSQIIYLSSNFVFSGENRPYLEMDIPDPNTIYGRTQASAEFYIQKTSLNYLVFRVSRLYGRHITSSGETWFEKLQRYMLERKSMVVDDYIKLGFLDINYVAIVLKLCIDKEIKNRLFQVSSKNRLTFYNFAKIYSEVFGENGNNISKGKWSFPIMSSSHTNLPMNGEFNFNLDLSNLSNSLNLILPTVKESLEYTFHKYRGVKKTGNISSQGDDIIFI